MTSLRNIHSVYNVTAFHCKSLQVKRKAQDVGPFDCTKFSKNIPTSGTWLHCEGGCARRLRKGGHALLIRNAVPVRRLFRTLWRSWSRLSEKIVLACWESGSEKWDEMIVARVLVTNILCHTHWVLISVYWIYKFLFMNHQWVDWVHKLPLNFYTMQWNMFWGATWMMLECFVLAAIVWCADNWSCTNTPCTDSRWG